MKKGITFKELRYIAPQNHIFIVTGKDTDIYLGNSEGLDIKRTEVSVNVLKSPYDEKIVDRIIATHFGVYQNVLEVILKGGE